MVAITIAHPKTDSAVVTAINHHDNDKEGSEVPIPDHFICPLTLQIFMDPVVDSWGHNFERTAILEWLRRTGSCPLTRRPLKPSELLSNEYLQIRVKQWQEANGREVTVTKREDREIVAFVILDRQNSHTSSTGEDSSYSSSIDFEWDDQHVVENFARYLFYQQLRAGTNQEDEATRRRRRHRRHHHRHVR